MVEFFKWINDNPTAGQILLLALLFIALAFCAAVIIFIWAFIAERPISMFVFKIPESNKIIYETGKIALPANKNRELYERNYKGRASHVVSQRFTKKFNDKPDLVIGLVMIDGGIGIVRVEIFADQITPEGFTMHFDTWEDSRLDNAAASWIAIGRR